MQQLKSRGVLIDSDLLAGYLLCQQQPSSLRRCLGQWPCFTTFIQAAELLACAKNQAQKDIIDRALCSVKILGAHARYAEAIASIMRSQPDEISLSFRDATVVAMARESKLAIAAGRQGAKYRPWCELLTIEGL
jgi:hypothetical protein